MRVHFAPMRVAQAGYLKTGGDEEEGMAVAEERTITKEDIFLRAQLLSECVRAWSINSA